MHSNGNGQHPADLLAMRMQAPPAAGPARQGQRTLSATYDAARDSDEFRAYWNNADALDADSANSLAVRQTLVPRARYETGNNGYIDGMIQMYATLLVGRGGPSLRMQTGNTPFNQAIEGTFASWAAAIGLRRKLWCMTHAKVQDGESFGILATNPGVKHRVMLDLLLVETEQCQTPMLPADPAVGYIDGIRFDDFSNPLWYDVLPYHPGSRNRYSFEDPKPVAARYMAHWYQLRRPGQHRGVPEFRSTLHTGAASRRFREATVAAAETAAQLAAILTSNVPANSDTGPQVVAGMSQIEFTKRMLMAAPFGYGVEQMKGEHPNATYGEFHRQQLGETAKPKNIPYNLAAGDSSTYSFASGKLDTLGFYAILDCDRLDAEQLVLEQAFPLFWEMAVEAYAFNADPSRPPRHAWDWPKHPVADEKSNALAIETKLRTAQTSLTRVYADQGLDFEDEIVVMARDYGVSVDEMRAILRQNIFAAQPAAPAVDPEELKEQLAEELKGQLAGVAQ